MSHTIFRLSKLILLENWVSANIFPVAKFSYDFPFLLTGVIDYKSNNKANIYWKPFLLTFLCVNTDISKPGKTAVSRQDMFICERV
jgi:hypothetical protein